MSAPDPFALGGRQDDPILAMIAEQARIWSVVMPLREAAEKAIINEGRRWFEAEEAGDPLFDEVHRLENESGELADQLREAVPTTIAGVVALLEWNECMVEPEVRDNVVVGLREIARRAGL
jgi:hypothetical protein